MYSTTIISVFNIVNSVMYSNIASAIKKCVDSRKIYAEKVFIFTYFKYIIATRCYINTLKALQSEITLLTLLYECDNLALTKSKDSHFKWQKCDFSGTWQYILF